MEYNCTCVNTAWLTLTVKQQEQFGFSFFEVESNLSNKLSIQNRSGDKKELLAYYCWQVMKTHTGSHFCYGLT